MILHLNKHGFFGAFGLCTLLLFTSIGDAKSNKYSREELRLAKPSQGKFFDWRLKKVYQRMLRQYQHLYSYAAADGYIFPNERRELHFHLRMLNRIITIDRRNHKVLRIYRRLIRKRRKLRRRRRWRRRSRRRRARRRPKMLASDERALLKDATKHKLRYEKMIRRFACRYLRRYRKKHKRHCSRRKP